jgi:Ca-activated chloride channel family protein
MLNKILLTCFLCFLPLSLFSQSFLPPNAVVGDCYAKCLPPDQYETVTEQVLLKEASSRIEVFPAEFETVKDSFLLKAAHTVYEFVAPTFGTITDSILVEEASKKITHQAAVYETVTQKILIKPASTQWIKSQKDFNCICSDTEDCVIWCLEEIPAEYTEIEKQVLKKPAETIEKIIAAKYKKIEKIVMLEAAHCVEREVPAEYAFFETKKIKTPAHTREIEIPAEYGTVTTKKLVRTGGFTDWVNLSQNTNSQQQSPKSRFSAKDIKGSKLQYAEKGGESYSEIVENGFKKVSREPLSTFSIDIDGASYSNVRRFLNIDCTAPSKMALAEEQAREEAENRIAEMKQRYEKQGRKNIPNFDYIYQNTMRQMKKECVLPPKDAVRTEEFINYFKYEYPKPAENSKHPLVLHTEIAHCPWNRENYLVHIGLQAHEIPKEKLPPQNLVFLLDVSGSMNAANKLPLVKQSITKLVEQMRPKDRMAIVVYAGAAGLVLPPTADKTAILEALERLKSGGSTAGGKGLELAYKTAYQNFNKKGNNRIILATDGDFNVGLSSDEAMKNLVEKYRDLNISLSVLGFGTGNYQDAKMELMTNHGNGNYAYIDKIEEGEKVLVREMAGTLQTVAKDVKIQIEFSDEWIESYRLIGYENRLLENKDFDDDRKDAGDMGAGHSATALYEIVPKKKHEMAFHPNEHLLHIKFRYKLPKKDKSRLLEKQVFVKDIGQHTRNFNFSAAAAGFAMLLRNSEHKGNLTYDKVLTLAQASVGKDEDGLRHEFVELVKKVKAWNE